MCRIAGIIDKKLPEQVITDKVNLMCKALRHGGPDDKGLFYDKAAALAFGHRRLALIDLSPKGHQPMADTANKVWITFNGEIYNYLELKQELIAKGASFNSGTDTEVILEAYLHWGVEAFGKMRGMFAFALFDSIHMLTYLVRDTTGVKPLYYAIKDGKLSFASEIKAFKAAALYNEEEPGWKIRFLAYGHIPEPYTTLKDVYSLQKGHYLVWDHKNSSSKIISYAIKRQRQIITDVNIAKELIEEGLKAAVKRQLISDAPIGVFLSGGIDSSLLTLLANQQKEQQLKTISIYFNEKAYDEKSFQNIVLKDISGEKFGHLVKQQDFENLFPHLLRDMDMPTTDGINTWFISRYAQQDGLKAVLSGVGADELFGGYPSFHRIKYLKYLRKLPPALFNAANYFRADKYRKISFLAHDQPLADYLLLRGLFVPGDIAKILDTNTGNVNETLFSGYSGPELNSYDEEHAAWFETNLYMQNQLLRDTDVMSMSHGLEVRVPFLDEDFQAMVENIEQEIRFNNDQPKKLLVDSFLDILPEPIWNRPKMGFTFPLQEWMSNNTTISDQNLYKSKLAQNTVKKFKTGQVHWSKVFALFQLQMHG